MKIIDAHIHFGAGEGFGEVAQRSGQLNSVEYLLETMRANGVVKAIAMGTSNIGEVDTCTPMLPDLAAPPTIDPYSQPESIAYCCGIESNTIANSDMDKVLTEFERCLRTPQCVGFKLYMGYNHFYAYDKIHFPFYELAEKYDVPVVIHTGETVMSTGLLKYAHPLTIDEVAVAFPKVRFVMAHYGTPWIVDATEVVAKNENVFIDLSGLIEGEFDVDDYMKTYHGYVEHLRTWMTYLSEYEKFLFGTDWPLVRMEQYIEFIRRLTPEKHHPQIFHQNATHVFPKLQKKAFPNLREDAQ